MKWLPLVLLWACVAGAQHRVALVVGENRGLANEELLRFAEADAVRVKDALVDVGGFAPQDVVVLQGATADALRGALKGLGPRLASGGVERLFVYVSSHAGDGALHLKGTTLPLDEVVDFVKQAPVKVGLLVVDACRSGSVTGLKGLKPAGPPVRVEASGVEGRVLIAASGVDEYAQESEALKGSTFTHHLVAGLRGAADASGDGRVTLDEVYAWAWARTIESTFASRGGVQRPAFSVDLRGQGQLVLSEPGRVDSRLTLDVTAPGRWLVVHASTGTVVADVDKPKGPMTLGLRAGGYVLRLRTGDGVLERTVEVPMRGGITVGGDDLERASLVKLARKGAEPSVYAVSAGGAVASGLVSGLSIQAGVEVRARRDGYVLGPLNQVTLALAAREGESGRQPPFRQRELELRAGVGHRFAFEAASLAVGVEAGPLLVLQSQLPDGLDRTGLGLSTAVTVELRAPLWGPVEAYVQALGGGGVIRRFTGVGFAPRASASLGLCVSL